MNEFLREQFVTKELAQQLQDMGYSEECFGYYQNAELIINALSNYELNKHRLGIPAPLWQQVIDWLREKRNIHIVIARNDKDLVDFATSRGVTTMLLYRWYFVDCYINWRCGRILS
jgi:hypothetical protein